MDKPTKRDRGAIPPPEPRRLERVKRWSSEHLPGGMRTLVIGNAILVVLLLVWAIQPNPNTANRGPGFGGGNQPQPVGIAQAQPGEIRITLNALGTVTPLATVTVKPQVGGQLAKINFTEGGGRPGGG
ncbi:MAG TPA: hypothetical protein VEU06_00640 [Micropepsaceae bacterium]|nr:hypothetical protein [Micropepsaceae bacterium]